MKAIQQSTDERERIELSADLVALISPFALARERLFLSLQAARTGHSILTGLASIASRLGSEPEKVELLTRFEGPTNASSRIISQKNGSTGAQSIKLRNLRFDFGEFSALVAGILALVNDAFLEKKGLLAAAGILLAARSIYNAMTVEIAELEASVFFGFIQASDEERVASETAIRAYTNIEREKIGLPRLTEQEVKSALHRLARIKSVERLRGTPGGWRIIEKYHMRRDASKDGKEPSRKQRNVS